MIKLMMESQAHSEALKTSGKSGAGMQSLLKLDAKGSGGEGEAGEGSGRETV